MFNHKWHVAHREDCGLDGTKENRLDLSVLLRTLRRKDNETPRRESDGCFFVCKKRSGPSWSRCVGNDDD
jgi:hypothetical protein